MNQTKPTTHQGDLTKLPRPLAPLVERPQWAVWRWTQQKDGRWQKPPFQALDPQRHASTRIPSTWCDYATALAAVQAGKADGITYVLTEDDPFAAIDLDHCRHPDTHSIDVWAQNFLDVARHTYARSDADRRRLPDLGPDRRLTPIRSTENSRWRSTASRLPRSCSGAPKSPDHHRLSARHHPGADKHRQGVRLGYRVGRAPQSRCAEAAAAARAQRPQFNAQRRARPRHRPHRADRARRRRLGRRQSQRHCFTRSSAITSAAAGASSRSTSTCGNSRTASPAATSARAGFARDRSERQQVRRTRAAAVDGWKAPEKPASRRSRRQLTSRR